MVLTRAGLIYGRIIWGTKKFDYHGLSGLDERTVLM